MSYSSENNLSKMDIPSTVKSTLISYSLIEPTHRVCVLLSGGKDSGLVLYLLKEFGYNVSAIHLDLGYGLWSKKCREAAEALCKELGVFLKVVSAEDELGHTMKKIRDIVRLGEKWRFCHTCGVIRRRIFNIKARELGADRVATGHNLDDEIQTFLMNLLRGNVSAIRQIGPINQTLSTDRLVPRIKPLCFVSEDSIRDYVKQLGLPIVSLPCPCSFDAFRGEVERYLNRYSPRHKLRIYKRALMLRDLLRKKTTSSEINSCALCGEPSKAAICRPCSIYTSFQRIYLGTSRGAGID